MLSTLLQTAIKVVMTNHTYSWKGEVRIQKRGGGIGDKLAQAAARLYMIWWDRNFIILLESAGMLVGFYKRFVDDGKMKLKALDSGAVWDGESKTVAYINQEEDIRQPDRRTAEVIQAAANSVSSMLVWTVDFPSANQKGRLPILDIEMWCEETEEGTRTCYSFYCKPMANPVVIPAASAVPVSTKYATFRQEVGRILSNTSLHLPWHHKAGLLSKFSWRLKVSGYPRGFRSKVISDGIAGYINTMDKRLRMNMPLNRPRDLIRAQSRNRRRSQSNWFNEGGSHEKTFDSVLFVPATPSSRLALLLKAHEAENNQGRTTRIKIVEKAGRSVKNALALNDPWEVRRCEDENCFPCSSSTDPIKISCRVPGVVYTIICLKCEQEGKKAVYFGESGKNAFEQCKKH